MDLKGKLVLLWHVIDNFKSKNEDLACQPSHFSFKDATLIPSSPQQPKTWLKHQQPKTWLKYHKGWLSVVIKIPILCLQNGALVLFFFFFF